MIIEFILIIFDNLYIETGRHYNFDMRSIKFSIITVCLNSSKTILSNIQCINKQTYKNLEHIFIDSNSTDNTLDIIKSSSQRDFIIKSEIDNGIYDAMNKGLKFATGDYISFLNSDDFYSSEHIIEEVNEILVKNDLDILYGNIDYINSKMECVRTFRSPSKFTDVLKGFQIPHPAIFIKTEILKNLDFPFNPNNQIASDFEQQIYLAKFYLLKTKRLDKSLVKMRLGGKSSQLIFRLIGWRETARSYKKITDKNGFFFLIKKIFNKFNFK